MLPKSEEKRRGLSVREASNRGGWSRATTYRLISSGQLKSVKVLGRRIITPEAVDIVLAEGAEVSQNPGGVTSGEGEKRSAK
jgi:excisionase family DNA binding protein